MCIFDLFCPMWHSLYAKQIRIYNTKRSFSTNFCPKTSNYPAKPFRKTFISLLTVHPRRSLDTIIFSVLMITPSSQSIFISIITESCSFVQCIVYPLNKLFLCTLIFNIPIINLSKRKNVYSNNKKIIKFPPMYNLSFQANYLPLNCDILGAGKNVDQFCALFYTFLFL